MNPKVDAFIENNTDWQKALTILRDLTLACDLNEMFKWKQPCYTLNNSNILIISHLKDCCTLSFFKGALLKDTENILIKPGENSQSVRYLKFYSTKDVVEKTATIKAYIFEAIEVEKAGLKIPTKKEQEPIPEELTQEFIKNPALQNAFNALTPGRQRGYILYFSGAKQPKTRISRIEKYRDRILNGKGFHDCVCGLSKKMPTCDGSHKYL